MCFGLFIGYEKRTRCKISVEYVWNILELLDTGTLYKLVKLIIFRVNISMVRFLKAYRKPDVGFKEGEK